jgi:hypothetical protein
MGAVMVALVAAGITAWSMWLTYKGSGKRLTHEAEMQAERLAEERRREGMDAAVKAYALASKVAERAYFRKIKQWADEGIGFLQPETGHDALDALKALEMIRVVGWKSVRDPANSLWLSLAEMGSVASSAIDALQVGEKDAAEIESDVDEASLQLRKSLVRYRKAINP